MKSVTIKLFIFLLASLICSSTATAQFTQISNPVNGATSFYQLGDGGAAWGDYDADGDLDLALNGRDNSFIAHLIIYQNNGDRTFSVADADTVTGTSLIGLDGGGLSWGDFDNDGDLDLIQTGFDDATNPQRHTILYGNNNGVFSSLINPVDGTDQFLGSDDFNPNWVDYDHDGDLDLFYVDTATGDIEKGVLYTNNGDGTFTRNLTPVDGTSNFEGYREADAVWGDYNNDGYIDLYAQGASGFQGINSTLYKNNGDGTFSLVKRGEDPTTFFSGTRIGATDFVDYDVDGDLDLFYTGETRGNSRRGDLYANNGDDTFSFVANVGAGFRGFTGVLGYGASWGDFDGDGDNDLAYGGTASSSRIVRIYSYQGLNDFDELFNPVDGASPFEGFFTRAVLFADYDGDGDLDLLSSGTRSDFSGAVILYENTSNHNNAVPSAPQNLQFKRTPVGVELSWDAASDDATPSLGLNYEIRVGTSPGGSEILAPLSIVSGENEGKRLIPYRGAVQGTSTNLNLTNGTYYWSVQAIDAGLNGSVFATEQMIEVTDFTPSPPNLFALLSPENGVDTLTQTPGEFIWQKTTDSIDHPDSLWYTFELSDNSNFSTKLDSIDIKGDTSYTSSLQLALGMYYWRVSVTNSNGLTSWGSDSDNTPFEFTIGEPVSNEFKDEKPLRFLLEQNYPNPFNPSTTISFNLPKSSFVTLKVFDMLGQEVAILVNERQSAGNKSVLFDASALASGIYLYRLEAGGFIQTRKMMLIK